MEGTDENGNPFGSVGTMLLSRKCLADATEDVPERLLLADKHDGAREALRKAKQAGEAKPDPTQAVSPSE